MVTRLAELMTRDTEPEMIKTELYNTVINAMRQKLIGTQLLAMRIGPGSIPGSSINILTQDKNSMTVHTVGEGGEIPIEVEAVRKFNVEPVKYAMRPLVTKEMQEDNNWDAIGRNLKEGGYQMARKLDSLVLTEFNTAAALTTDDSGASRTAHSVTGGTTISVKNITDAMAYIELDDYNCTDFIIDPNIVSDIRNLDSFVEADKAGVTNPSQSLIGRIFGMNLWISTNLPAASYGFIIDRQHAVLLAEKRPLTVERYDDVTRDLSGVVLTARWKARYLRPDAIARIITT